MTISKTLFGASVDVPETPEEDWGSDVTGYNVSLIDGVNATIAKDGSSYYPKGTVATVATLTAAGSITRTAHKMRISSASGAVTLSTSAPISAGTVDGQELVLVGTSDTNTVTIQDSGNAAGLNGDITFTNGVVCCLWWDDTSSLWRESSRSN